MQNLRTYPGGLVIIFEGLDGVGKTTQLRLAQEALEAANWSVWATRNLGGTPIGEELRQVVLGDLSRPPLTDLYIAVAIQEALSIEIEAKRSQGQIILVDRGPMSFAAYLGSENGVDEQLATEHANDGMKKFRPDLTLFYTLDIAKAQQRLDTRNQAKDHFESKPLDYLQKVEKSLVTSAERYNATSVSADSPIEAVHLQTMEQINRLLKAKSSANEPT